MNSTVQPAAAIHPASEVRPSLRHGSLNLVETIGQSVANIAPTGTPALTVAVIAGMAGIGSWLAFLIATIGMMFVAGNIATLARRHPQAGSYFVYIGRTLGPLAGMTAGWSMVAAYLAAGIASVVAGQIFLGYVLDAIGIGAVNPPVWLFDLIFVALVCALAYRDIRISSRVGVVIECLSLGTITLVTAIVLVRHGTAVDRPQLDIPHLGWGGIVSALTLAAFSFVGFESAATLAKEARDPTRAIPRAIMLSAGLAGLFFTVITYAMVLGVGDEARVLANSSAPFAEITTRAGLPAAAMIVYLAALISVFACALACVNAVSRLMFSMGRYEFIHRSMGVVHDRHQTPHLAISAAAILIAGVCIGVSGLPALDGFGLTATFSTFGFLVVYLLICIVAPVDLYRAAMLRPRHVIVGIAGVLLMAFMIFGSLYPVPDYPYDLLPYLFAGLLLIGGLWYGILAGRAPHALAALQHDLE
jgi:amino acid transporter